MTPNEIRARRVLVVATPLLGAVTAWVVARSQTGLRDVLAPVQLAMSVLVPFLGVLAVADLHRPGTTDRRLAPRLLAALALAAGFALAGVLLAAVFASASPTAGLVAASVLVQLIAQATGTGSGLLIRRPAVAMAATIVVPMSVTVLLRVLDPGGATARWLTPYGNAESLFAGTPSPYGIAVVVVLWCVVPNVVGGRHQVASTRA